MSRLMPRIPIVQPGTLMKAATSASVSHGKAFSGSAAPVDAFRSERATGRKEGDLVRVILQYLALIHVPAWRSNTGAVSTVYKGRKRFIRFGFPGVSDILGIVPPSGRLLALEVKSPTGRVTEAQLRFLQQVNAAGGLGFVARSLAAVEERLGPAGLYTLEFKNALGLEATPP